VLVGCAAPGLEPQDAGYRTAAQAAIDGWDLQPQLPKVRPECVSLVHSIEILTVPDAEVDDHCAPPGNSCYLQRVNGNYIVMPESWTGTDLNYYIAVHEFDHALEACMAHDADHGDPLVWRGHDQYDRTTDSGWFYPGIDFLDPQASALQLGWFVLAHKLQPQGWKDPTLE